MSALACDAAASTGTDAPPLTRLHLTALVVCSLGFMGDLFELGLAPVMGAVFSAPGSPANNADLAFLLASVYVGAVVGTPLVGRAADALGRRTMLVVILVWLAATSAGAAFAGSISTLTGWRVLAGFALGAYPPVMTSYLSELIEPRRRAALVLAGSAIALLGAPLGPLVVRHMNTSGLLGLEGWRWGLLSGAIGTAVFALAMSRLPESAQWLAAKGFHGRAALVRARFARSAPVRLSLPARGSGRNAANAATPPGDVGRLYLLSFLSPWATVAFPVLSGAVLITKGFRLDDTLLVIAVAALGPSIGVLVTSPWLDLVSRRSALLAAAAGMGVSGWFFVVEAQVSTVVAAYTAFIVSAVVYTSITNVFVAERSPTRRRSTLVSIAWTLNRISAAVAPFVLLPMLRRFGAVEMFVVVALTLAASIVLLWAWRGNDIYVQRQRQG